MPSRRAFLAGFTAPWLAPLIDAAQAAGADMKIAAIDFLRFDGRRETVPTANRQHQVQPLHIYDEHRPKPYHEPPPGEKKTVPASAVYLRIRTAGGLDGFYGPIDKEALFVVKELLRPLLAGKNALAVEMLWDQMYRSNRHSRASHFMIGISAVDNALWDLRGRYFKAPVYQLLGGPTRSQVEAYGSCLGFSIEPESVAKRSAEFFEQGFRNQKWFLAYGPGDHAEGMRKNVELVATLRETLGDRADIMFDAFQGWSLDYAINWAKQVEKYRPRWIEEAFQMDRMESFVKLRQTTSVPVATGEHMYGRWEAKRFLEAGAISVVQADPEWCGGTSELAKICHIASTYDAQVIPHGHALYAALHVVASQSPLTCPLVEYLITKMESYYHFEKQQLKPVNGRITLPTAPGFGIEFDPAKVEKQTVLS
ncbi:MAG: mandelate racemase [Bryobacterales bacterium]|nr:mandelate racemase [Bryobacterales bacterium]